MDSHESLSLRLRTHLDQQEVAQRMRDLQGNIVKRRVRTEGEQQGKDSTPEVAMAPDNDSLYPDLDPRVVATKAAIRDARLPYRVLEPGVLSGRNMQRGVEYHV